MTKPNPWIPRSDIDPDTGIGGSEQLTLIISKPNPCVICRELEERKKSLDNVVIRAMKLHDYWVLERMLIMQDPKIVLNNHKSICNVRRTWYE